MRQGLSTPPFRLTVESLETRWVPANVGSANLNFVDQLYRDLLHRAPDPASAGWVAALDRGEDRSEVVDGILNTEEGLRNQVNDLYVRFLGRAADASGLTFWTDYLRDEDNDNLDLAAELMSSQEYYLTQGGGTDRGFLNAVYQDVLGRPISNREVDDRGDDFDDGVEDRRDIAEGILESDEAGDASNRFSSISFLRANSVTGQGFATGDDGDDDDDYVFARSILASQQYYAVSQTLTKSDFATIPSADDADPQPFVG